MDTKCLEQQKLSCVSVPVGVCACVGDAFECLLHTHLDIQFCMNLFLWKGMSLLKAFNPDGYLDHNYLDLGGKRKINFKTFFFF